MDNPDPNAPPVDPAAQPDPNAAMQPDPAALAQTDPAEPATIHNSEDKFNEEAAKRAIAEANAAPDSAKEPPHEMDQRSRRVYGTKQWRVPTAEDVLVNEVIVGSAADANGRGDLARTFSDTQRLRETGKKAPGLEDRV